MAGTMPALLQEMPVSLLLTHVSTNREGPKVTDGRYVSLRVTDEASRMVVAEIAMSAAEFTQMMSGATVLVREGAQVNVSGQLGVPRRR